MAAATRTPFESARRVFVIEAAEHDERPGGQPDAEDARGAAGVRPPGAADATAARTCCRRSPRAASRCASTRCPGEVIAAGADGARRARSAAQACARLALGDAGLARSGWPARRAALLRAGAEGFVRAALRGTTAARPWLALLEARRRRRARRRRAAAERGCSGRARAAARQGAQTPRARRRRCRAGARAARAHAGRSIWGCAWPSCGCATCCACAKGPPELVYAVDRRAELEQDAQRARGERRCGEGDRAGRRHAPEAGR